MKKRIVINPEYERLKDFVAKLADEGVPTEAESIYTGRNTIYRLKYDDIELNIKSFHEPHFPNNFIYAHLRKSKARRSYEHAMEIRRRGISTPCPVAWVETSQHGSLRKTYYVSLQSQAKRNMRQWETWPKAEAKRIVSALAHYMKNVHEAGILHHDFSPGNILWYETPDGIEFEMVDLNRIKILGRPLNEKERYSNFRNINYYEPGTEQLGQEYGIACGTNAVESGNRALKVLQAEKRRKNRLKKVKKAFGFRS